MSRKHTTALYSENGRQFLRHLTLDESNSMLASEQAEECFNMHGKCIGIKIKSWVPPANEKGGNSSPAYLTASDMENNGFGAIYPRSRKPGLDASGHKDFLMVGNYIDRAMSKVEEWPYVGDTKALRVGPGGKLNTKVVTIDDPHVLAIAKADQNPAQSVG